MSEDKTEQNDNSEELSLPQEELDNYDQKEGTFLEHLEDLRGTLLKCAAVFAVSCTLVAIFIFKVSDLLVWPLNTAVELAGMEDAKNQGLVSDGPMSVFSVILQICFLGGTALAIPFMLYFAGQFVAPGLTPKERRFLVPGAIAGMILFITGVAFCFFFIIPAALAFSMKLNESMNLEQLWSATRYYGMIVWMTMAVGISFQFPLVLLILINLQILNTKQMTENRRIVVVICCFAGAVITPGGDALTLIMIAIPLYILYEASIIIGRRIEKTKMREEEEFWQE